MSSGFLNTRLDHLHQVMAGYVARGVVPGVVTLLARRGEVVVDTLGAQAIGGAPMQRDTIFRVASMTKPITAVAAMILVEECQLRLDDPVDTFLPELANRRVLKSLDSALDDTVPASRSITLRDLLTFRLGVGSVLAAPGTYPIQHAISELRIGGDGPPQPAKTPTPDEWMRNLGSLPLMEQPGERWLYNVGADVLGVLIARASGQAFGDFLHERIFEPLNMCDTGFSCQPTSSTALRRATRPTMKPARSHSTTQPRAASGPRRRPSSREPAGWSRRRTTTSRSATCCSARASSTRSASSHGPRSRR